MKKLIVSFLILALVAVMFTGCVQSGTGDETETAAAGIPLSEIKIGVLLNNITSDGGWNQALAESFTRAKTNLGLTDDQVIIIENIPDAGNDCANAIEMLVDEGCNMIFCTSAGFTDVSQSASAAHPEVYFHQFEGNAVLKDNLAGYSVRDYQTMFLLGYAGAKLSSSDRLGFMAAQPTSSVVRVVNAYALGAKYANPNATLQVVWANSWYDPSKEKEGATSMLENGINVLGYHGSTTAVAEACSNAGAYMAGFHINMESYAPDAVYSSHMWNWTPMVEEFVNRVIAGTWKAEMYYPGIDSGCVELAPWNTQIVSADLITELDGIKAQLEKGEIEVFEGPLYDNAGNELLKEGETFTDDELIGMMFLADNVLGQLPG